MNTTTNHQTIGRRTFLAGAATAWAGAAKSTGLQLAPDSSIIVIPKEPDEEEYKAAKLLQDCLRQATRSKRGFEIASEDRTGGAKAVLAVGHTRWAPERELTGLYRDGFILRRSGNAVIIAGGAPPGTFYGATCFLDRFCGVRFYMPGNLFTSLPSAPELVLGNFDVREEPFVKNCMMSGVGGFSGTGGAGDSNPRPDEREWLARNAAFRKESMSFSHQHSMYQRFPPQEFAAKYPEIYPIINGQRYIPSDPKDQKWQPCLTEPKLVDAAEESALEYFRQNPKLRFLSFSIQDSHVFCQCSRCQDQIARHHGNVVAAYSDMNAAFLNHLAERLETSLPAHGLPTDKVIVYIAYADVRNVPSFPIHRSILPVVVFKISDILIDKVLEPGSNLLDAWAAAVKKMGNHDWGEGHGYFIPRDYVGLTSRFFRYAKTKDLEWTYQHFEAYPNWGFDGPRLYLTSRIWWNPDVDVDALWRQFCADMFPSARQPMFEHFMSTEKLWIAMDGTAERKIKKWSNQFTLNDEQWTLVRRGRQGLDRAASLASTPEEKQRIELFSKSYRLSELLFAIANAPAVERVRVEELRRYVDDVIAPDPMTTYLSGNRVELMKDVEAALAVIMKGKQIV